MILNRLGNKSRIASKIISHFPQHRTFIDMFFGAGGIFFNKPVADYNFCNDIDDDVFNLWYVMQNNHDELVKSIEVLPITESLLTYWNTNKESDIVKKAVRFLMLSNFGYMGKPNSLHFSQSAGDQRANLLSKIPATLKLLSNCRFMCRDFRDVLGKISFRDDKESHFVYADPPYINTDNNYSNSFTEQDTIDLFEILVGSGLKFAISEFDNEFVINLAKSHNLNIIEIGERQNMKNRRTEILITNYAGQRTLFDSLFK